MDVTARLQDARVLRVAIVDDDLSERLTLEDLELADGQAAALLNDEADPDREAYLELLAREGRVPTELEDLAEPLSEAAIREAAPARLREAASAALAARAERAEPVRRVIGLLEQLGIGAGAIDRYSTPEIAHDKRYDLIIVDYFLVDASADSTLPFIRGVLEAHVGQERPLQIILMSSHEERLKTDFKTIRPRLHASSSRMRIMQKPWSDMQLVSWKAALYQLASDRDSIATLERFVSDAGTTLKRAAAEAADKLWELDLQAMDLLHELATSDNDDYVRYVEDAASRRLLSELEEDGGLRPSLQLLDAMLTPHRDANLLSPTAEIGDSRAAIHALMHSMEWRSGTAGLPAFPSPEDAMGRAMWIRRHLRFGMVLRDPEGGEWLNITQACDLAQTSDDDIGQSTVIFLRGQRSLPAEKLDGSYYYTMSAMMARVENHVLTWNLRNVRSESIQSFCETYGVGWQVVGELRLDVAQNVAAIFGARAARVALPVTLSAWRLSGCAIRVGDIWGADDAAPLGGTPLSGFAIRRAVESKHELHLDHPSLDALVTAYGAAFDDSVLQLVTGIQLKKGSKSSFDGRPVILYCKSHPENVGGLRRQLSSDQWLGGAHNTDRVLVALWCAR